MFKLFWLWESKKHEEDEDDLVVEEMDEKQQEDIGQIALDVLETTEKIIVVAPIAWVRMEEIDISLVKTVLTIKWNRKKPSEYSDDWVEVRNTECFWGKFVRNIILPENLALNSIKAYMENNLLIINIPKLKFDSKNIKIDRLDD